MRFGFIAKHSSIWPVAWLCEALGASRSGFHVWLTRAPRQRAKDDEMIGARVRASFIASARTKVKSFSIQNAETARRPRLRGGVHSLERTSLAQHNPCYG